LSYWSFALACLSFPASVNCQAANSTAPGDTNPAPRYESRQLLQAQADSAVRQGRNAQAWLLRSRLTNGDFQEGDRIVVTVDGAGRTDTIQVRAGKLVQVAGMADLSLDGVLRSELEDRLRAHFARYLRNPVLRATPLLPVAVLGAVNAPGFYYAAADVALRDVIMRAGGPIADADMSKTIVRRNGEVVWSTDDVRIAMADGLSLDRLHLRAGDQVVVPPQRHFQLTSVLPIISSTLAIVFALMQLRRH